MTLVFKAKTKNKIINPKTSIYLFTVPYSFPKLIFSAIFHPSVKPFLIKNTTFEKISFSLKK